MTTEREIERVLERWLIDGIDEMPERVYFSILDRVERQPQQRAWRVSWRDSTVNAYLKPILAVAAALVLVIGGFAIVARPSGSNVGGIVPSTPSPSPTPSLVPTPSPSPTAAWDNQPQCGQNGCGGPQGAGSYTSRGLIPALSYSLTSDWVNVRDWPDFFMLYPDTDANRARAAEGLYAPYILILPGQVMVSPSAACPDEDAPDAVEVDAIGFVEFLQTQQHLSLSAPVSVTVGGLTGRQIDVGVESGWTGCLPQTPFDLAPAPADRLRYIVLEMPGGGSMMIELWAPDSFDAFVAAAMPVVESFEFDLSQQPSPSPS